MCCIYQVLELIWRATPRRYGEEICDVISKRRIICVFLYSHQLHGIVTELSDSGDDIVGELNIRVDFWLNRRHANVSFIDSELVRAPGSCILKLIHFLGWRVIIDSIERDLIWSLNCKLYPRGDLVNRLLTLDFQVNLDACAMRNSGRSIRKVRQENLKHTIVILRHPNSLSSGGPAVEVPKKARCLGAWRPLTISDTLLIPGKTHDFVSSRKIFDPSLSFVDCISQSTIL
mmetsp:Transcript_8157/g.37112  ORF Transcript_8157/g.37112 Transcript_8157/m.37112 type:complete len:231 (-) Transcript_8157:1226-1918(-)